MKMELLEAQYFKDGISIVSDIVNEIKLRTLPEGIEVVAMDPANVVMTIFRMKPSCFSVYEPGKDEVGLNLSLLKQILRRAAAKDPLKISVSDNRLHVSFGKTDTRTFSLPIIEIEEKTQKVPKLEFTVKVVMPGKMLSSAVADADIVAESVAFVGNEGRLNLVAAGDLSSANVEISGDAKVEITGKGPVKSRYSVEYLQKLVCGDKICDNVAVSFAKDYPLLLEFKQEDKVELSFILAPRVDSSDD